MAVFGNGKLVPPADGAYERPQRRARGQAAPSRSPSGSCARPGSRRRSLRRFRRLRCIRKEDLRAVVDPCSRTTGLQPPGAPPSSGSRTSCSRHRTTLTPRRRMAHEARPEPRRPRQNTSMTTSGLMGPRQAGQKVRNREVEEVREADPDGRPVLHHRTIDPLGACGGRAPSTRPCTTPGGTSRRPSSSRNWIQCVPCRCCGFPVRDGIRPDDTSLDARRRVHEAMER